MPSFGLYEYKVEGSGGLWVQSKTGPRWDWFIIYHKVWNVLIEQKVYTTTMWQPVGHFLLMYAYDEKNRQKLSITYVIRVLYKPPYFGDAHMLHLNVESVEIDVQYTVNGWRMFQ